jgi:hypothetical protein
MFHKFGSTFLLLLFFASCTSKTSEPIKKTGTLPIKAAVIYDFGGPQPVSQTKFYLLNKDFDEILEEKGENHRAVLNEPRAVKMGELLYELMLKSKGKADPKMFNLGPPGIVEEGIKQYIVATTTTDFEGNGNLEDVPLGKYFLVGFATTRTTRTEQDYVLWTLPVEVKASNQPVLVSQVNGFVGFAYKTKSGHQL